MVKRILYPVLQFAAFLGLLFVGGMWDSLNMSYEMRQMANGTPLSAVHPLMATIKVPLGSHILIAQGVLFATMLLVLILLIQAIAKKLKPWAFYTLAAYVLAAIVAYATKMGLPPSF
jgi:uncharacterized membrane protein